MISNSFNIYISIDIDLNIYWTNIRYSVRLKRFIIHYYKSTLSEINKEDIDKIIETTLFPVLEYKGICYSFKDTMTCNNFIDNDSKETFSLINVDTLMIISDLEDETENVFSEEDIKELNSLYLDILSFGFVNIIQLKGV